MAAPAQMRMRLLTRSALLLRLRLRRLALGRAQHTVAIGVIRLETGVDILGQRGAGWRGLRRGRARRLTLSSGSERRSAKPQRSGCGERKVKFKHLESPLEMKWS